MIRSGNQVMASILVNAIYEMRNYPVVLLNTVLSPLSFLVLIFLISDGALLGEAILGGLIMSMFQSGISLQTDLSHLKNDFKLQEIVVSSPTRPLDLRGRDGLVRDHILVPGHHHPGHIVRHKHSCAFHPSDRNRPSPLDGVPLVRCTELRSGHDLYRHRTELFVQQTDHDPPHLTGTGVLPHHSDTGTAPVPRIPFTDHLCCATRPTPGRADAGLTRYVHLRLGGADGLHHRVLMGRDPEGKMERCLMKDVPIAHRRSPPPNGSSAMYARPSTAPVFETYRAGCPVVRPIEAEAEPQWQVLRSNDRCQQRRFGPTRPHLSMPYARWAEAP